MIIKEEFKKYTSSHQDKVISQFGNSINYFLKIYNEIPNEYKWIYSSEESIKKQIESVKTSNKINKIYWLDQLRIVESYNVMSMWRVGELLESCVEALNNNKMIIASSTARAIFEMACVYSHNAKQLSENFKKINFDGLHVVISSDLEKFIVQMIWATRYGNPEDYLKQKNIMTSISKITKHDSTKKLDDIYNYLCDIVHPSFLGNTVFWNPLDSMNIDRSENRMLSNKVDRPFNGELLDRLFFSISFSLNLISKSLINLAEEMKQLKVKVQSE